MMLLYRAKAKSTKIKVQRAVLGSGEAYIFGEKKVVTFLSMLVWLYARRTRRSTTHWLLASTIQQGLLFSPFWYSDADARVNFAKQTHKEEEFSSE